MPERAPDFDPLIHQPARLKVMLILARLPVATFHELARDARLTPGNLATHLKALEAAGYVRIGRGLVDLKPRVRYAITPEGRDALRRYCAALREAVAGIEGALDGAAGSAAGSAADGLAGGVADAAADGTRDGATRAK